MYCAGTDCACESESESESGCECECAVQALTVEEAQERRERLAKTRSLLFAHEQKAKRLKAIKSKGFHRHAKKAAKMKVPSSLFCIPGAAFLPLKNMFCTYLAHHKLESLAVAAVIVAVAVAAVIVAVAVITMIRIIVIINITVIKTCSKCIVPSPPFLAQLR